MIRTAETTEQRRKRIDTQWRNMKRREHAGSFRKMLFTDTAQAILRGHYDDALGLA